MIGATLTDYREVVGSGVVDELSILAGKVRHRRLQHINSTAVGGGVAEILTRMVPLLRELGVDTRWDVIKGDAAFFAVTKTFHNALHGTKERITRRMFDVYRETLDSNLREMSFDADVIVVHDPQPAGLVAARRRDNKWIWRCHVDISTPDARVWNFLSPFVCRYNAVVVSMPQFAQPLSVPQFRVPPSIDPLSDKNRDLAPGTVAETLARYGLDPERPIITQISRFDRLKDPLGVIEAYRLVRRRYPVQLVLAGGGATDDPEGAAVLQEVRDRAEDDKDIHVILLPPYSDLEINALVRGSTVVMQKSIKEGFGLTVAEALWKKKPVIGGAVGGITLQVLHGVTGFLVHSPEGAAFRTTQLLANPALAAEMGENGHRLVKENFLSTRHVRDYLLLMLAVDAPRVDLSYV